MLKNAFRWFENVTSEIIMKEFKLVNTIQALSLNVCLWMKECQDLQKLGGE